MLRQKQLPDKFQFIEPQYSNWSKIRWRMSLINLLIYPATQIYVAHQMYFYRTILLWRKWEPGREPERGIEHPRSGKGKNGIQQK